MPRGFWKYSKTLIYGWIALAALGSSGCAAVVIGGAAAGGAAAGYAYYRGNVYHDYNDSLDQTWVATYSALSDLGMPVVSYEMAGNRREIQSSGPGGEKVGLYLEEVASLSRIPQTRVHIRIGMFGDQVLSKKIHNQIGARLQQAGQVPLGNPIAAPGNVTAPTKTPVPLGIQPVAAPAETAAPPLIPPPQVPPSGQNQPKTIVPGQFNNNPAGPTSGGPVVPVKNLEK